MLGPVIISPAQEGCGHSEKSSTKTLKAEDLEYVT